MSIMFNIHHIQPVNMSISYLVTFYITSRMFISYKSKHGLTDMGNPTDAIASNYVDILEYSESEGEEKWKILEIIVSKIFWEKYIFSRMAKIENGHHQASYVEGPKTRES